METPPSSRAPPFYLVQLAAKEQASEGETQGLTVQAAEQGVPQVLADKPPRA